MVMMISKKKVCHLCICFFIKNNKILDENKFIKFLNICRLLYSCIIYIPIIICSFFRRRIKNNRGK